jgi:hypothetical protein
MTGKVIVSLFVLIATGPALKYSVMVGIAPRLEEPIARCHAAV